MRNKKFQVNWYQTNDTAAMERKLEKMAEKGWLLDKVSNWGWHYRRAEPQQVKYTMTFFPDASIFDGSPTEGQETYADYCAAVGWELAAAYGPMQYFRSTRPNPTPIETDEGEKLHAIHKSMLKTSILSYGMLTVVWLMNLALRLGHLRGDPLTFLSSNTNISLMVLIIALLVYMVFFLVDHFIWYFLSKKAVERGEACLQPHTKLRFWFTVVLLVVSALAIIGYLSDITSPGKTWIFVYAFGGMAVILALSQFILHTMKRKGFSRGATRFAFIAAAIVLSVAYAAGLMPLVMRLDDTDMMDEGTVYTHTDENGWTWEVRRDDIPLTLENIGYTVDEEDHYTYEMDGGRSFLVEYRQCSQWDTNHSSDLPDLSYYVAYVRWDWLRERILNHLLEQKTMQEVTDPRWGADRVYFSAFATGAVEDNDNSAEDYLLVYGDRIVWFETGCDIPIDKLAAAAAEYLA